MTNTIRARRKAIADRLGLPADATNEQIFAEIDDRTTPRTGALAQLAEAEHARAADEATKLYALAYGAQDEPIPPAPVDLDVLNADALYEKAWGA